MEWDVIWQEKW